MVSIASLSATIPMLLAGMAGVFLVIGILVLAVAVLNRLFK